MAATVTVTNEVDAEASRALVMSLDLLDQDPSGIVQGPFVFRNGPVSFTAEYTPRWEFRTPAGARTLRADWTGNESTSWKVMVIEGREYGDPPDVLERMIARLEEISNKPSRLTQQPPRIYLDIGLRWMICILEKLTVTRKYMDEYGNATVAEFDMTFREVL